MLIDGSASKTEMENEIIALKWSPVFVNKRL